MMTETPQKNDLGRLGHKAKGVANWILDLADENGLPITNMALNKLVYFAVEKILLARGQLLTNARIEAWEHGPVFREVYHSFKLFGDKPITGRAKAFSLSTETMEVVSVSLAERDEDFLKGELLPLMRLPASVLREISHASGGPWEQVWTHEGHANPGMEITAENIIAANLAGAH